MSSGIEVGYALSSEEHTPQALIEHARLAETSGFPFALISDHFHPWVPRQGESPFVWSVIGGIAQATKHLRLGTGVTCPIMRLHPAIVAQAAATAAVMMPGRFFLGVGTGERLNEHILGQHWPEHGVRAEMLEEAIVVMRDLWEGGNKSHHGRYYTVENARLFTLPDEPPAVVVAASGPGAAELAGRIGDGLCCTAPERQLVTRFETSGGAGKPKYGQMTVCWAANEADARRTAHEWWPNSALKGPLNTELALPSDFDAASDMVTEEDVAKEVVCGPDAERHLDMIKQYADAGFTHVYVHQVGPDQEGFIRFYAREVLPRVA